MSSTRVFFATATASLVFAGVCTTALGPRLSPDEPASAVQPPQDPIDAFLSTPYRAADGFDLPIGDGDGGGAYVGPDGRTHDGWYVATKFGEEYALGIHPGEDWNGRGGGNSDLGQPVRAIGHGLVVEAAAHPDPFGNIVIVEHVFFENAEQRRVRSVYIHLHRLDVKTGDEVARGQQLGTIGRDPGEAYPAHLHLEIRTNFALAPTYWPSSNGESFEDIQHSHLDPSDFILNRRSLPVPGTEAKLLVVHHASRQLRLYERGAQVAQWEVALGQLDGKKEQRGDLKTPVGAYFVVEKSEGPFSGDYADYYGGVWIKVNYPNAFDAARGVDAGLITPSQQTAITTSWRARKLTPQNTKLGGGIGFHGWIEEWDGDGGANLSWGCVVLHPEEAPKLYAEVPLGTMVVMLE